ncbi:hypothetical protein HDV00_011011 [Rhizophlyctis rosea]|nr:hypothetical protein HDV00_011011 [Rhizophlyctis rosea]
MSEISRPPAYADIHSTPPGTPPSSTSAIASAPPLSRAETLLQSHISQSTPSYPQQQPHPLLAPSIRLVPVGLSPTSLTHVNLSHINAISDNVNSAVLRPTIYFGYPIFKTNVTLARPTTLEDILMMAHPGEFVSVFNVGRCVLIVRPEAVLEIRQQGLSNGHGYGVGVLVASEVLEAANKGGDVGVKRPARVFLPGMAVEEVMRMLSERTMF